MRLEGLNGLMAVLEHWLEKGLDLIYPGSAGCPLCRAQTCSCREALLRCYRDRNSCSGCGKFLGQEGACYGCASRGAGFPEKVLALGPYQGQLREALHRFKYSGEKRIGKFLADLLLEGPALDLVRPDLIVPVPLHPGRLRQRGYNQALVLAERLALGLGIPLGKDILFRTAATHPQASLQREARRSNLVNAFEVRQTERLKGKSILLVDDIITTGSTLEACGQALRQGEIRSLQAICVAAGVV